MRPNGGSDGKSFTQKLTAGLAGDGILFGGRNTYITRSPRDLKP
jgi:hypothetical protein